MVRLFSNHSRPFFQHCRFRYRFWCRSFAILGPLLRMRHGWIFPWQWHARSYHLRRFVQASRCLPSNVSPFETSTRSWSLPWWRFLPSLSSLGESRQDERHPRRWILDRPSYHWDTSKLATLICTFQRKKKFRQIISRILSFFHRPVMCPLTSQPTSFLSLTDKFSWRPSCSTKVFAPLSTSVCLYPVSDLLPRLNPWNKYDFTTFSFKKGQN